MYTIDLSGKTAVVFGIAMMPLCVVFFHVSVRAGCTCLDVGFTIVVVKNNSALSVHQAAAQPSVFDRSVLPGVRRPVLRTRRSSVVVVRKRRRFSGIARIAQSSHVARGVLHWSPAAQMAHG